MMFSMPRSWDPYLGGLHQNGLDLEDAVAENQWKVSRHALNH